MSKEGAEVYALPWKQVENWLHSIPWLRHLAIVREDQEPVLSPRGGAADGEGVAQTTNDDDTQLPSKERSEPVPESHSNHIQPTPPASPREDGMTSPHDDISVMTDEFSKRAEKRRAAQRARNGLSPPTSPRAPASPSSQQAPGSPKAPGPPSSPKVSQGSLLADQLLADLPEAPDSPSSQQIASNADTPQVEDNTVAM